MKESRLITWVIVVAFFVALSAYYASASFDVFRGRGMGGMMHEGDLEVYYSMKAVLSSVNAFLLGILTVIYFRVYSETGLEFSLGLVVFSFALLLYALFSNPLLVSFAGFRGSGLGPFAMLPDLFTCIASLTLLYISQ